FLMSSFGDGHAHPLYGGLEAVGPPVRGCGTIDEIVTAVKVYAEEHPDEEWIVGASYDGSLAEGGLFDARWLDAAVPDRPVVLRAWDYHTLWCNTAAIERAGITPDTPDPVLGEIPRRPDGSVLGTLREWGATDLVMNVMPPRDERQRIGALGTAADYYLARGVTWVQDAWVEPGDVATYVEAARQGALRMRFNLALYADPRHFDSQITQFAESRRAVEEAGSPLLTANTVKFFADGVVENETGALLAPYCSGLHSHGMQNWEGDSLAEAARRVDELGLQIHIHAIGDAAVRQALDAIEYTVSRNGIRDRRPVIAHVQLVDDTDIGRFAELGVIPNMLGSDWPVSSGAPLDGIAVATSRLTAEGQPEGGWTPHEIVPIERAPSSYTGAVAYQAYAENTWGVITPGASADLVWLDQDPRNTPPLDLPRVGIHATYLRGAQAYRADEGKVRP
ncbi:MAG: amidohydrolase, partial [Mycolicibacterium aromaticivorans]|nr:amidohydrolase [Mycolicibacterium aromaticivorans]